MVGEGVSEGVAEGRAERQLWCRINKGQHSEGAVLPTEGSREGGVVVAMGYVRATSGAEGYSQEHGARLRVTAAKSGARPYCVVSDAWRVQDL